MSTPFTKDKPKKSAGKDMMLPSSIEGEQAVLGAILADSECFSKVIEVIEDSKSFYKKAHQKIYETFLSLSEAGNNIDIITTSQHLKDRELLEEVGGRSYLSALTDDAPIGANGQYYAKIVQEKALLRNLITAGNEIVELGYETEEDLDKLVDKAEQLIFGLAQSKTREDLTAIGDMVQRTWEILEEREANKGKLIGVDTGFYDLNAITAGLQKSDLIIVAARPAMGKCLHKDSEILLEDGRISTIEEIYKEGQARLLTLNLSWKLALTSPSKFIDDGIKPIFELNTRLGKKIKTTITHPYLTVEGWRKLGEIKIGDKIAVPRSLQVFGSRSMRACEAKLLGYLIGDGCLRKGSVEFTNNNPFIQNDFIQAVEDFDYGLQVKKTHDNPNKAETFRISKNQEFLVEERALFAQKLKHKLKEIRVSQASLASRLNVSSSLVDEWCSGNLAPSLEVFEDLCRELDLTVVDLTPNGFESVSKSSKSSLRNWLAKLDLDGKDSHSKFIPALVFELEKDLIALFLNRLFATDGWASVLSSGQSQIGYATVSEKLARQVQHLLLRFGVIASLKKRNVKYKDTRRLAWQLDVTDQHSIKSFINDIGIFGKEDALKKVEDSLKDKKEHFNRDLVPLEIWKKIEELKGTESWTSLAKRAGIKGFTNIHPHKRALSRRRLKAIAEALSAKELLDIAESDVYWDEVVSINYLGKEQVYDLTIPDTHNFVSNDICVHNTALCTGIAESVAMIDRRPVAIFSLEMSKEQLVQRMLCSRAQVDSNRIRTGQMYPEDWTRLGQAMSDIGEAPIFIDDSAGLSIMEIRGKCRRLKAEHGDLGLIVIDYLQLMHGKSNDNRMNQISEISRGLKLLARELDVPVVALSQLSRAVEARQDKRPMLSDLRESGSIEQDADIVMFVYRDDYYNPESEKAGVAEIIIAKQRSGPVGTIELLFQPNITRFRNPVQENN